MDSICMLYGHGICSGTWDMTWETSSCGRRIYGYGRCLAVGEDLYLGKMISSYLLYLDLDFDFHLILMLLRNTFQARGANCRKHF